MIKFLLPLLISFWAYSSDISSYPFKTIDKSTGNPSEPLKKTLQMLGISPNLSGSQALATLQERYGRKPNQERYELSKDQTIEQKKEDLSTLFTQWGITSVVSPSETQYDFIIILGSTIESMRERVAFLLSLINKKTVSLQPETQLLILTGDRELFPYEDITRSKIHTFRKGWMIPAASNLPKTEGEAASVILDQLIADSSLRNRIKVLITPKRYDETTKQWVRPHTGNTIETLLMYIKNPQNKKFLFISNNPYVAYQHAIITREFLDRSLSKNTLETVGSQAMGPITIIEIDNLRNTLQRELEVWERLQKPTSDKTITRSLS